MTETRKESLSALIDGEASEIEVHRLVREFKADDSLASSWAAYQHIRATVRSATGYLPPAAHQSLFQRISEAVGAEDAHTRRPAPSARSGKVVFGSLALAASLVLAVFVGVQPPRDDTPVAGGSSPVPDVRPLVHQSEIRTPELVELDEEKQRRLRAYLNQHDRMARMNPGGQFVNYEGK